MEDESDLISPYKYTGKFTNPLFIKINNIYVKNY